MDRNFALILLFELHSCSSYSKTLYFLLYFQVKSHFDNSRASGIVIACYLLENGADLNHFNHEGKTALDICDDSELIKLLCEFGKKHRVLVE